jgi:hypothetical protein
VTQTPSHTPSAPETGLDFFRKRKININNFNQKNLTWKANYPGSLILCSQNSGAANAIIVGQFSIGNLHSAVSDRGYDPSYRVILNLDAETIGTLQKILESGPFNSDDDDERKVYSPLKNDTATFSVKFKILKQEEKKEKEEKKRAGLSPVKKAIVKSPVIKLPVVRITERNLSTFVIYWDNTLLISDLFRISSSMIYFKL